MFHRTIRFATSARLFFLALTILLIIPIFAFAVDKDADLELFEGGKMDGVLRLRSSLISGTGVQGALTGMTASPNPTPFIVFGNPAVLGQISDRRIVLSTAPPLNINIATLTDPNPYASEEVDVIVSESFNQTGPRTNPQINASVGRGGALISGLAVSFVTASEDDNSRWFGGRIPRLFDRIAFGWQQPLVFDASMIYDNLRTRLRTIEDDPSNDILLLADIRMDIGLLLTADCWTMGAAKQLNNFWIGVGIRRTSVSLEMIGNMRTDGLLSKASSESAFNDPLDPWHNDFYSSASGKFSGSTWGTSLGATYQAPENPFFFGIDFRLPSRFDMDGYLDLESHRFPALKLTVAEGGKRFDVNDIEDVSELTRTYAQSFIGYSTMEVNIPGALSFGVHYSGSVKPTLTLTKYFGELSYRYKLIENGTEFAYRRGLVPNWGILLGMKLPYVKSFSIGITSVKDVVEGYHDAGGTPIKTGDPMLIPRFSVGFENELTEKLTLGILLFALPEDALRFTLDYRF